MRTFLKNMARTTGTEEAANKLLFLLRQTKRNLRGTDRKIIAEYLSQPEIVKKLHIGCGDCLKAGWLNSDYYTKSKEIIHLDATKRFPFDDNEFAYVFSEHMIEHIPYRDGSHMLKESFRVLKPGGMIRVATPDLSFLIDLYSTEKTELQNEYIVHSTNKYIGYVPFYDATFVINNYVRAWGHQFIYNEKVLRDSLEKAGFANITRLRARESHNDDLRDLENVARKPAGMIEMETLVLEATKL